VNAKLIASVGTPPLTESSEVGLNLKGCWEERQGSPYVVVYRNCLENPTDKVLRILVPVTWENPPPIDCQFWELRVEVRGGELTVTQAEDPFEPPPKATEFIPPPAPAKPEPTAAQPVPPILPLTIEEIRAMATPAKIQVTCKLNEVPKHRELADKRVEFFLQDGESDRIFTIRMKPKIFKKLTDHGFTEWVAAITGEIGPATETGFELVNAAVQVFEKKARETEVGQKGDDALAVPEKSEGDDGIGKRKSLLDGVRMK
jgi:hypothetical protein